MPYLIQLLAVSWIAQASFAPAYVREGDRVEAEFRAYRDGLERFYGRLSDLVDREMPGLLADLMEDPPPEPVVYGYRMLPPIEPLAATAPPEDASPLFRSYSWPLTEGYIEVERGRLDQAGMRLASLAGRFDADGLTELVGEYHALVDNQDTIDQHIQYNRFWQRSVAENREKFDRLDELYDQMLEGDPQTARQIRAMLGRPAVPPFVTRREKGTDRVVELPVYTDIDDETYLRRVEAIAEGQWHAVDAGLSYQLDVVFRFVSGDVLYAPESAPRPGDHIDLEGHVARFRTDAAVLTTGAESTHALVGRAVLLGSGSVTPPTVAHEIGHLLGFPDGYVRGYEDLGDDGYEIREVISEFDDLMTAPSSGRVWATHFELIQSAVETR